MSKIPVGVRGRVLNGKHSNTLVRVEDDSTNTESFLIYQWWDGSDGPNQFGAFDDWVESAAALEQYFAESGWRVAWEQSHDTFPPAA